MATSEPTTDSCLDEKELRRYFAKELADNAETDVRNHLQECDPCSKIASKLRTEHESWVDCLRKAGVPPSEPRRLRDPKDATQGPLEIAGYKIIAEISRGGQGIVYRALQESTKREVALKVLHEGPYASISARKRFEREIELVAGFRHPNIVTVFDSGVTADHRQYCVMDYIRGDRLGDFLQREQPTLESTLTLMATICDAVNYAHLRGVIHRDLKPSNILIDAHRSPKVLDFGLAKEMNDKTESLVTSTGLVAGTLPYLAPEQALGHNADVDIRSDVYALGVILFETLTGEYPYPVTGDVATVLRHITDTPPARPSKVALRSEPSSQPARCPAIALDDEVETIVLKALAKEPERRYQTAGELGRDIRQYLAGEPIEAKRDSGWYVFRKMVRRHKLIVTLAAAFVVFVTAAAISLGVMYRNQSRLLVEVQTQKALAEGAEAGAKRRFDQVRDLATTFINELDPRIRDLAGAAPARQFVVETGLEYLNNLAADSEDDVDLQASLGAGYLTIGMIQGDPQRPNLGDQQGALINLRKALSYVQAVAKARPDSVGAQIKLYAAYHRLANLEYALLQRDAADADFQKARRIIEQLADAHPENRTVLQKLYTVVEQVADQHRSAGRFDEAMALYRRTLAFHESSPNAEPLNRSRAACYYQMGEVMIAKGEHEEALTHHTQAVDIMEGVVDARPDHAVNRTDLAWGYERLSFLYQQLQRHEEALAVAAKGLTIHRSLRVGDPHNARARRGMRACYCRMGEAQLALGDQEAALASFSRFREVTGEIAAEDPDDPHAQREVGVALYKMAELHMALAADESKRSVERIDHWTEAKSWTKRCLDHFLNMKSQGKLLDSDNGVPDEMRQEIAKCEAAIDRLSQARE